MQVDNGKGEMIPAKKSYNFNQWDELDSNTHTWPPRFRSIPSRLTTGSGRSAA